MVMAMSDNYDNNDDDNDNDDETVRVCLQLYEMKAFRLVHLCGDK